MGSVRGPRAYPVGDSPPGGVSRRGLVRPISGQAPPEGALDLRVSGDDRLAAVDGGLPGKGGPVQASTRAGDQGRESLLPRIHPITPGLGFPMI